jgi:hypothetical protein
MNKLTKTVVAAHCAILLGGCAMITPIHYTDESSAARRRRGQFATPRQTARMMSCISASSLCGPIKPSRSGVRARRNDRCSLRFCGW